MFTQYVGVLKKMLNNLFILEVKEPTKVNLGFGERERERVKDTEGKVCATCRAREQKLTRYYNNIKN